MDVIRLYGMRFYGRHGVFSEERALGQPFIVHVEMRLDLSLAGRTDQLEHTVDYGQVYQRVRRLVEGEPVRLVECLAERIAAELLAAFPLLESVGVTVAKPFAPIDGVLDTVEVAIERTQDRQSQR
ncbi:MAG: dihydroneopterin aldolase [Alicyclobacillaceae bacterium]|nr:dihydroneopterin aldolase [Alicyclobacillaceae bacterium]